MVKHLTTPAFLLLFCTAVITKADDSAGLEFFEKKIRPQLVEHCYACHSQRAAETKKLKGGLMLDSREAVLLGGDSGTAVVPGKPDESLLLSALRYEDFEMPPKGKLPEHVVGDFAKWIEMGAPDPRDGSVASKTEVDLEQGRKHWAYQPLRRPVIPEVRDQDWPRTIIDRFILSKLEQDSLQPAADVDLELLVRRVYYALVGLPPTPEETDELLNSAAPSRQSAIEALVNRLMASPRFGERWGRHWLDVVRFGESNTLRGTVFSQAWRFRDYVIDSLNDDLSFDRFILEQVAGDLLSSDSWQQRRKQLTASGMLSLGNSNFENQDKEQLRMDVVDEQLEVIGRAFLAQTIACARCHNHKFDPIPTRDYYAMAGILRNTKTLEHANVSRWLEVPLPLEPAAEAKFKQHEAAVKKLQQQIAALKKTAGNQSSPGSKSVPVDQLEGIVIDSNKAIVQGAWTKSTSNPRFVDDCYIHDANEGKGQKSVTFKTQLPADGKYDVRISYSAGSNRASNTPVKVWWLNGEKTTRVDQRKPPKFEGLFFSLGTFELPANEDIRVIVANDGTDGVVIADSVQFLPQQSSQKKNNKTTIAQKSGAKTKDNDKAKKQQELKSLEAELKKLQASGPKRELTMSVLEESKISDTRIHIRGNVHNLGAEAPRGFLQVVSYESPAKFSNKQSGRRQLGEWLSSDANPLTARVIVNRLWHWLFGVGLVRTVDNFGTVGELPSHPELLDYLATELQQNGWSIKSLLRQMILSRTFQMSSHAMETTDVENRLLWRMNRRRLEAECVRDTILAVSGQLQLNMHGPTFPAGRKSDYDFRYEGLRRGVYAPVFRNALVDLFEVFDVADPSIVVGRRSVSTVAPQALFMMNNPLVIKQSQLAAARLWEELPDASDATRVERAYRLALGRRPTTAELNLAAQFVATADDTTRGDIWAEFYQALFASLDFRYVD